MQRMSTEDTEVSAEDMPDAASEAVDAPTADMADDTDMGDAETPGEPQRPRNFGQNEPRGPDYRAFTMKFDETIAAALDGGQEKPERLALEPWLYRLALNALEQLSRADDSNRNSVHLEESARPRNIKASDEPELQFHQPDEAITEETIIADDRVSTPEEIVGSDELVRLIASSLRDIASAHREAFILHAVEGFGVGEISAITGVPQESVLHSISAARAHLRKSPGLARQFKGRFISAGTA